MPQYAGSTWFSSPHCAARLSESRTSRANLFAGGAKKWPQRFALRPQSLDETQQIFSQVVNREAPVRLCTVLWATPAAGKEKRKDTLKSVSFLVRREGFEPPAFWSVVALFSFYVLLYLHKFFYFQWFSLLTSLASSHSFWRTRIPLCAKCAPKNGPGSDPRLSLFWCTGGVAQSAGGGFCCQGKAIGKAPAITGQFHCGTK